MAYPSAADLDIANAALARISERTISSFTENSPAARAVARLYSRSRSLMFAAMDWRFATARAELGAPTEAAFPWQYEYPLPPNVSRSRMVLPSQGEGWNVGGEPIPFEEGVTAVPAMGVTPATFVRVIRCDITPATLIYTALIEDPTLWDDGFAAAFTVQLAAELAFTITGNGQIAQGMRQEAQAAVQSQMPAGQAQSITPQSRGPSTTTLARQGS